MQPIISRFIFPAKLQYQKAAPVSFRGNSPYLKLFCDIYEKSKNNVEIKSFSFADKFDNPLKAVIYDEKLSKEAAEFYGEDSKKFVARLNGENIGHLTLSNHYKEDCLVIQELFTKKDKKGYKGIGTELLKLAVLESQKRGFEGKIKLTASNEPPPFVFYYKNNFLPDKKDAQYLAAIDYAARNNIDISKLLNGITSISMSLSKEGAQALLKGERLYEKRMPV